MPPPANHVTTAWPDPVLDCQRPRSIVLASIAGFLIYFAGVVAGSALQPLLLPGANMGWFQQVGGILAVLLFALLLQDSSTILGLGVPRSPWLVRSVLVGLSITVLGGFAGLAVGDPVHRHGIEYFAYEATMPGIGEELGFRGVLLGCLIAGLARRDAPSARRWLVIVVAAIPFAALHLLERSGWQLAIMSGFTLYAGAALGWARLSTGSLLTAVLAHNVANVASGVIDNFLA